MQITFYDLPPDHPIFSGGPHFVFKNDPPEEDVTYLAGAQTREEFLAERDEDIEIVQPRRPPSVLA